MGFIKEMTRMFTVTKTLNMGLEPVGRTGETLREAQVKEEGMRLDRDLAEVKPVMDAFFRNLLEEALEGLQLKTASDGHLDSLEEWMHYYSMSRRSADEEEAMENVTAALECQVRDAVTHHPAYRGAFGKGFLTDVLPAYVRNGEEAALVERASCSAGLLARYFDARRLMFENTGRHGSVPFRTIRENLPAYARNIRLYERIAERLEDSELEAALAAAESSYAGFEAGFAFCIQYYYRAATQAGIQGYNAIVGQLNAAVKRYNDRVADRADRLPSLQKLYKQILSDRVRPDWLPEGFASDREMALAAGSLNAAIAPLLKETGELSIRELAAGMADGTYDTAGIYLSVKGMATVSCHLFRRYDVFSAALRNDVRGSIRQRGKRESEEAYEARIGRAAGRIRAVSLDRLESMAADYCLICGIRQEETVISAISRVTDTCREAALAYEAARPYLAEGLAGNGLNRNREAVSAIKAYYDALAGIRRGLEPLFCGASYENADTRFYSRLAAVREKLDLIREAYDKTRNWLSRKPYDKKEYHLTFGFPNLLGGWDPQYHACLLMRDTGWFLGVELKRVAWERYMDRDGEYRLMSLRQIANPMRDLPHSGFSRRREAENPPMYHEARRIKDSGSHREQTPQGRRDLAILIGYYRNLLEEKYGGVYSFSFRDTEDYAGITEFFEDVKAGAYSVRYAGIPEDAVDSLVESGQLCLFRITKQDFLPGAKGTGLSALYWKSIFAEENGREMTNKLLGGGGINWRPASIAPGNTVIHPAGTAIDRRTDGRRKSVFRHDIIKDRRFTREHFDMHIPVKLNSNCREARFSDIDWRVRSAIREGRVEHIIGINRGERNLVFVTVTGMDGRIVESRSLNMIGGNGLTDYHRLLTERARERDGQRRNWQEQEQIKNLKAGWCSQAVHEIAQLAVRYEAIVAMEDLDVSFKNGRSAIEKSVYQKFEAALADKLSFLVTERKDMKAPGGVCNALQLCRPSKEGWRGAQNGILFRVSPWGITGADPATGFLATVKPYYSTVQKARALVSGSSRLIRAMRYDRREDTFTLDICFASQEGGRKDWTLYSDGTRIWNRRNPGAANAMTGEEICLTGEMKTLFREYGVSLEGDLLENMLHPVVPAGEGLTETEYWKRFVRLLGLLLTVRNFKAGDADVDYITSPARGKDGRCFDSRTEKGRAGSVLPAGTDENGSWNIARKAGIIASRIREAAEGEKVRTGILKQEWLDYLQGSGQ